MNNFSGRVNTVVYENEDFKILKVLLDGDKKALPVIVKGNFYDNIAIGTWISFEADWVNDNKYGKQLSVTRYPVPVSNWTEEKILSALTAQGVSMFARTVLEMYCSSNNVKLFDLLNNGDLSSVEKLKEDQQDFVIGRWNFIRAHLETTTYLYDLGLSTSVIASIWKTIGSDIEEVINQDPWILVRAAGISFIEADRIAEKLGVSLDNKNRINGAILSVVKTETSQGDLYIPLSNLIDLVRNLTRTSINNEDFSDAIKDLVHKKSIVAHKSETQGVCVYLKHNYDMETYCTEQLVERLNTPIEIQSYKKSLENVGFVVEEVIRQGGELNKIAEACVNNWSQGNHITLTETQKQASISILTSKVSVLTGLPGTGKTTTLQSVVSVLKDAGIPFLLCAPTGIAAKRLSSVTGCEAMTVHRAFGAKGRIEEEEDLASYTGVIKTARKQGFDESLKQEWGFDEENPHPAKFIIVDESSMLDLHMLYRLLLGTRKDCHVVFVGDPYQLPSVGSGDILRDLVSTKLFNHTHLDEIFRQENTSGIVLAAHDTHHGVMPTIDNKDFVLFASSSQMDAQIKILQVSQKLYNSRYNFQVLSPRHNGEAGVTALNESLRQTLNPPSYTVPEVRLGNAVVREGDRVMTIKNDYLKGVYNGDVGKVSYIDKKAKEIEVKIHEGTNVPPSVIRYSFQEATQVLRLAYAQTVHKSQGQEYDIIVLPLLNSFSLQLQRNLFYTAITRAKKKVFIIGEQSAILKAVTNDKANKRFTILDERLVTVYKEQPITME